MSDEKGKKHQSKPYADAEQAENAGEALKPAEQWVQLLLYNIWSVYNVFT